MRSSTPWPRICLGIATQLAVTKMGLQKLMSLWNFSVLRQIMVVILFAPCVITLVHHREQIAISCWPNVVALRTTTLATAGKAEATKTKKRRRIILVWTRKKVLDTTSEQACNNTFGVWSHQLFFPLFNLKILVPFVTDSEL